MRKKISPFQRIDVLLIKIGKTVRIRGTILDSPKTDERAKSAYGDQQNMNEKAMKKTIRKTLESLFSDLLLNLSDEMCLTFLFTAAKLLLPNTMIVIIGKAKPMEKRKRL